MPTSIPRRDTSAEPQPPTKRRKKPSSSSGRSGNTAPTWETTRFFDDQPRSKPSSSRPAVLKPPPSLGSKSGATAASSSHTSGSSATMLPRSKSLSRIRHTSTAKSSSTLSSTGLVRKQSSVGLGREESNNIKKNASTSTSTSVRHSSTDEKPPKMNHQLVRKKSTLNNKNRQVVSPATIQKAKSEIAKLATLLVSDPQKNVGKLSELRQLAMQHKGMIAALALLTEAQVYRDISPGYRVRLLTEKESSVKVSKEVAQLRQFEQTLLIGFRRFLKSCISLSQWRAAGNVHTVAARDMTDVRLAACKAMCSILVPLAHFNDIDTTLAPAVVTLASDKDQNVRQLACNSLTELLANAHRVAAATTALTCISAARGLANAADGRRARIVSEESITPLSEINFSAFARLPVGKQKRDGDENNDGKGKRMSKRKRELLAKKNRKRKNNEEELSEQQQLEQDLDRDLAEGEADANPQQMHTLRKALLDAVCKACFNVIKTASADLDERVMEDQQQQQQQTGTNNSGSNTTTRVRKAPPALSAALRGLLRVARFISADVIDAIVTALVPMLKQGPYPLSLRFRCATVAYKICAIRNTISNTSKSTNNNSDDKKKSSKKQQDDNASNFETDMYALDSALYTMLGALSGTYDVRLLDEDSIVLDMLETLHAATSFRRVPAVRAATFARRLGILSLSASTHGSAVGILRAAQILLDRSMTESVVQDEEFKMGCDETDASGAVRSIAWELMALQTHFHPTVRLLAQECQQGICGDAASKSKLDGHPVTVARRHASADGGFNPLPKQEYTGRGGEKTKRSGSEEENDGVLKSFVELIGMKQSEKFSQTVLAQFGEAEDDKEGQLKDWCEGYFDRAFNRES